MIDEGKLSEAWSAVAYVPGPKLGDASAPLSERCAAFSQRLAAFRRVVVNPLASPRELSTKERARVSPDWRAVGTLAHVREP